MLIKLEHKKYYFVLFSAIHAGIADPKLTNLVWRVLELEAVQTKTQWGFVFKPGLVCTVRG